MRRLQRAAATQVEQRQRRGQAGGEHAATERQYERPGADHGARAERERLREVRRRLTERPDRERISGEQPEQRRDQAEAQRLEQDHPHDLRVARAEQAQVGDRVAALGDRQENRVEREQEAQQRADRGEELARLLARAQRLVQQLDVFVGRGDRQPRPGERPELRAHLRLAAGLGLHEDPRDPAAQPGERLQAGQPHHRHRCARQRAELGGVEHRVDGQRRDASAQLERDLLRAARSGPGGFRAAGFGVPACGRTGAGHRGGQVQRLGGVGAQPDPAGGEGRQRDRVGEPVEQSEAEIGAGDLHRRAMPAGAAHARGLFEQRRGLADAGESFHAREDPPFGEAFGAAGTQLEARGADHGVDDFARGAFDAAVGDRHREQQRDRDRHAEAGEQLLGAMRAQAPPVEVNEHPRPHQRRPVGDRRPVARRSAPSGRMDGASALTAAWRARRLRSACRRAACSAGRRSPPPRGRA